MAGITEAEILAEIQAALDADPEHEGAITTNDVADAMGIGVQAARKHVGQLVEAGKLECVWLPKRRMDGVLRRSPHYRPVA